MRTITAALGALVLCSAGTWAASLDDIDRAGRAGRNLGPLIALFLAERDNLRGELAEVGSLLDTAGSPRQAAAILSELMPELARERARRRQPARLGLLSRDPRPGTVRPASWTGGLPLAAVEPPSLTTVWLEATVDTAEQADRDALPGFEADGRALLLGIERQLGEIAAVGVAVGRSTVAASSAERGSDDTDSIDYLAYSRLWLGGHRFEVGLAGRSGDTDRLRVVRLDGLPMPRSVALTSSIDSSELLLSVAWDRDVMLPGGWLLAPSLELGQLQLETDDYVESGGGELGLIVTTAPESHLLLNVGLGVEHLTDRGDWTLASGAYLTAEQALRSDDTVTTSTFRGTRFSFRSRGFSNDATRWLGGLGFAAYHQSGVGVSVGLTHERQDGYRRTGGAVSVELTF